MRQTQKPKRGLNIYRLFNHPPRSLSGEKKGVVVY